MSRRVPAADMTARLVRHDMTDRSETADMIEPKLTNEPIENADANDPMLPIESIEPIEPMDKIDPREPMLRIEPSDLIDNNDRCGIPPSSRVRPKSVLRIPGGCDLEQFWSERSHSGCEVAGVGASGRRRVRVLRGCCRGRGLGRPGRLRRGC